MRKKFILLALLATALTLCVMLASCTKKGDNPAASGQEIETMSDPAIGSGTPDKLNPGTPGTGASDDPIDTSSDGRETTPGTTQETETEAPKDPADMMNTAVEKLSAADKLAVTNSSQNTLTISDSTTLNTTTSAAYRIVGQDICVEQTDADGTRTVITLSGNTAYLFISAAAGADGTAVCRQKVALTEVQREIVAAALLEDSMTKADMTGFRKLTLTEKAGGGYTVEAKDFDKSTMEAVLAGMGMNAATVNMDDMYAQFELDAAGFVTEGTVHFGISYAVGTESVHLVVENGYVFDYADTLTVTAPDDKDSYESVSYEDIFGDLDDDRLTLYVTANVLRVRSTPDFESDSNVVGYLRKGDAVQILVMYDGYALITYKDTLCYIGTFYLSETPPETDEA